MASVSLRARRRVSACALPRPSAIASAKLAKSTVNQSQTVTPKMKPRSPASAGIDQRAHELDGGDDAADLDDEHHRVLAPAAWIELLEGVDDGAAGNLRVEERGGAARAARLGHLAADAARPLRPAPLWLDELAGLYVDLALTNYLLRPF